MAESILPYFAVRRRSARLGDADRTAILAAIPNRLEYFDRQGFRELKRVTERHRRPVGNGRQPDFAGSFGWQGSKKAA